MRQLLPECHTAHCKPAVTGLNTLETLWLNLAAIISYPGSPEEKFPRPLAAVANFYFFSGAMMCLSRTLQVRSCLKHALQMKKKGSDGGS